ncbi:MAG: hypothetical protein JW819_07515 [Candidatus Krumholzibacteriota bacterium]|nr:hypothetical protein [Candidatus Krumholzibacteriota bacterium]
MSARGDAPRAGRPWLRLEGGRGLALAALLYALLLALLLPEAVFQGRVFTSPDAVAPAGLAEYLAARDLPPPAWNPFIFAGMPAAASLSTNTGLYPGTVLLRWAIDHLRLPPLSWLLAHYLWAALGVFLLARGRGARGWVAWLAGAVFLLMPSQVAIGAYGHGSKVMSLSWIPWTLLFTDRLVEGRRPLLDAGLLALSLAGLLLTAHVQVVYYGLVITGLFALGRLIAAARRGGLRAWLPPLALGLAALVLAAAASAPLYAPVHEYSGRSIRGASAGGGVDYDYATAWSLHPREWTTFLLPSSWGFGEETYFGRMPMTDYPNYLGAVPFLAALALFLLGPRRRYDLFFGGLFVAATLVAAGRYLPWAYRPLYDLLPGFSRFRVPVMVVMIQQLALALLFARGLERALRRPAAARRLRWVLLAGVGFYALAAWAGPALMDRAARGALAEKHAAQLARLPAAQGRQALARAAGQAAGASAPWLRAESLRAGGLILLVLGALEWRRRGAGARGEAVLAAALAVAVIADLVPLDRKILHPSRHWPGQRGVELLGPPRGAAVELPPRTLAFLETKLDHQRFHALAGSRFAGNEAAARGLANLGGYHAAKLAVADSMVKAVPRAGLPLLRRFAVRYLLAPAPLERAGGLPLALAAEEAVYEIPGARPRLFLADTTFVEPPAATRARVLAGAPVTEAVALDAAPDPAPRPGEGPAGEILAVDWGLDAVACNARLARPAVLVLADMNYPGWEVRVDGDARPLLTADGYFRAVALPAGEHAVTFRFAPPGGGALRWLRRVALLAALLLALAGAWRAWRERLRPQPDRDDAPGGV